MGTCCQDLKAPTGALCVLFSKNPKEARIQNGRVTWEESWDMNRFEAEAHIRGKDLQRSHSGMHITV